MAMLFVDGFDHYATADLNKKYDTVWQPNNVDIITTENRHSSGGAVDIQSSQGGLVKTFPATDTIIFGTAMKVENPTVAFKNLIVFTQSGAKQFHLSLTNSMGLRLYRGTSTLIEECTTKIRTNTWYYIELKVTVHNTLGSYELRINGEVVMSATNVDTQDTATAEVDAFALGNITDATLDGYTNHMYDDIYLLNDVADGPDDFLGDSKVTSLLPDGNGTTSNFTGSDGNSTNNFQLVDDNPPDGDTSYVESSTVGHIDLYTIANLPSSPDTIHGIAVGSLVRKDDAGTRTGQDVVRTSATNYTGTAYAPSAGSYGFTQSMFPNNPNSTIAWTESDINGLEIGIKVET